MGNFYLVCLLTIIVCIKIAKLALASFSNSLAKEGAKDNIHSNTIAPMAASRM
jgi:NAD(P)-dependent dehydrogenase (short-subunit alcohol dehydrogenase family)